MGIQYDLEENNIQNRYEIESTDDIDTIINNFRDDTDFKVVNYLYDNNQDLFEPDLTDADGK